MNADDLADYVASKVQDPSAGSTGVGDVTLFGCAVRDAHLARPEQADQLRPDAGRRDDRDHGTERAGLGRPARRHAAGAAGQQLNATITAPTRLQTPEQFGNILLQVNPDGSQVRLQRRRAHRARRRELQHRHASTTASRPPASASSSPPARTRWHTAKRGAREARRAATAFPARAVSDVIRYDTTPFVRSRSRRWSRR